MVKPNREEDFQEELAKLNEEQQARERKARAEIDALLATKYKDVDPDVVLNPFRRERRRERRRRQVKELDVKLRYNEWSKAYEPITESQARAISDAYFGRKREKKPFDPSTAKQLNRYQTETPAWSLPQQYGTHDPETLFVYHKTYILPSGETWTVMLMFHSDGVHKPRTDYIDRRFLDNDNYMAEYSLDRGSIGMPGGFTPVGVRSPATKAGRELYWNTLRKQEPSWERVTQQPNPGALPLADHELVLQPDWAVGLQPGESRFK